jgi:hypothetical protein
MSNLWELNNYCKSIRGFIKRRWPIISSVGWSSFLDFAKQRRLDQGEKHDLFAGHRADIVMQADHFDPCDSFNHRRHGRPGDFDQMTSDLLEQISAFFGWQRLDQVLLRRGQDAIEAHHNQIIDEERVNLLGTAPHVFLLEAAHALRDGTLDFSLSFHARLIVSGISAMCLLIWMRGLLY